MLLTTPSAKRQKNGVIFVKIKLCFVYRYADSTASRVARPLWREERMVQLRAVDALVTFALLAAGAGAALAVELEQGGGVPRHDYSSSEVLAPKP